MKASAPKKVTAAAARKALNAVEGDATRYAREDDNLSIWEDNYEVREREEIIIYQAITWLEDNGYDVERVGVYRCGYYLGLAWNQTHSEMRELILKNID